MVGLRNPAPPAPPAPPPVPPRSPRSVAGRLGSALGLTALAFAAIAMPWAIGPEPAPQPPAFTSVAPQPPAFTSVAPQPPAFEREAPQPLALRAPEAAE